MESLSPSLLVLQSIIQQLDNHDFLMERDGRILHLGKKLHTCLEEPEMAGLHIDDIFVHQNNGQSNWWLPNEEPIELYLKQNQDIQFSVHVTKVDDAHSYVRCVPIENNALSAEFLYNVLNSLPSDLAIFDLDHRYLFLNPVAIKNDEIRQFMLGKTDIDYCNLKNLDTTIAEGRHALFLESIATQSPKQWEDVYPQADGTKKTIRRIFSPVFNREGKNIGVLGYGLDITDAKQAQEYAETNEKRFRTLFENNLSGVFRTNEFGDILEINSAYAQIYGYDSVEELKQHKSSEFYPDLESRAKYLELLRKNGRLQNYLIENVRKDGKKTQLLSNVLYSEENGVGIIEGTLIDITVQQEAMQQLEEKSAKLERYAFFLDQTNDAIQVVDEEGHFVYLNKIARERLGIDLENMEQHTILEIEPYFKSIQQWKDHLIDLEKIGVLHVQSSIQHIHTGAKTPVDVTVIPRTINGKKYAISTLRDISEKLESQRQLDEKNRFLRDLTSAVDASSLVSVTDESGIIISVNANFCKVSGYSENELLGQNHSIVNSGYHTSDFWGELYRTLRAGEIWRGEIRNKNKDGSFYWVNTVIYPLKGDEGKPMQYMSIRQEVTAAIRNETIIQKQVNFQDLLIRTASKLINLDSTELDNAINSALKDVGLFVNADRSYIFDYNHKNETINNLYEWCREGIEPQIDSLQHIPFSDVPRWIEVHFKGEIMDIPDVSALPDDQFKQLLEVQDIKSLIAFPMMDHDVCTGFIGFDSVKELHTFNETDKIILELFAEMVVNINKRVEFISQIEKANDRYVAINEGLERMVAEKTAKNNELTQTMANQDKLAMIGEITAGITHDLNTPIGAIKVGAESIRYTLEALFKSVITECSFDQLNYACSRAVESNVQMFVGGMQTIRETKAMNEYIRVHFPDYEKKEQLSSALVKARIQTTEPEVISVVASTPNALAFADLIYHIQSIRTFVDTVLEAGDKASSVIKNLRFYLKEGSQLIKTPVNLHDNLQTVLNVFNHQLKYTIDLKFDVPNDIFIYGYETKLYQLWSNLIKNAIEAIQSSGELRIDAKKTSSGIQVAIRNTGEPIPLEIQGKIFEKFFTTKGNTTGTGLGLSIVRKVVEEHGAKIKLDSNQQYTSFIVTFAQGNE